MVAFTLIACSENKTTETRGDKFTSLEAKQKFLERYVTFRRHYNSLEYKINFIDGESGWVPGPTEWDVKLFASVPSEELGLWKEGLEPSNIPNLTWTSEIPNSLNEFQGFTWYQDKAGKIVGINPTTSEVVYRNYTQ